MLAQMPASRTERCFLKPIQADLDKEINLLNEGVPVRSGTVSQALRLWAHPSVSVCQSVSYYWSLGWAPGVL